MIVKTQIDSPIREEDNDLENKPLLSPKKEQKSITNTPRKTQFKEKLPPLFIGLVIAFYLSYFSIAYIIPQLFPNLYSIKSPFFPPVSNNPKKQFSSYTMIFILLFNFTNLIISFIRTVFTNCAEIPNDSFWQLKAPEYLTPQEKVEYTALKILKFEEELNKNKNRISISDNTNEYDLTKSPSSSASTASSLSNDEYYIINERNKEGEIRFCETCNKFKPDRAHHCKFCNRCYLKMDHHCFWMNNCITISNYKFFICFVFYTWVLCIQFFIIFTPSLIKLIKGTSKESQFEPLSLSICGSAYVVSIIIFSFSFILWCYNIMLGVNNYTSFEYNTLHKEIDKENEKGIVEYSKFDNNVKVSKYTELKSRYDIGGWNNWVQIYGNSIFMWFLPIRTDTSEGGMNNGFNFITNENESIEVIASI